MYPKVVNEYIKLKMETISSDLTIARDVINRFDLDKTVNAVRTTIRHQRKKLNIKAKEQPKRRLFFDIETSYHTARVWSTGKQYIDASQILSPKKIICISYKWEYEDKVHNLRWNDKQDDRQIIKKFVKILGQADEIIGHNGDKFDIKELRTRAISNGVLMFPTYRTLDTLKKSRQYFSFPSNRLDYIGEYLNVGRKMPHTGFQMWIDVVENKDKKALDMMLKYCNQDVILLEDVYKAISPYIFHNTNFSVLSGGHKWDCPECAGKNVEMYKTYTTAMGVIRRNMKCSDCMKQYRISNRSYGEMLQYLALKK